MFLKSFLFCGFHDLDTSKGYAVTFFLFMSDLLYKIKNAEEILVLYRLKERNCPFTLMKINPYLYLSTCKSMNSLTSI